MNKQPPDSTSLQCLMLFPVCSAVWTEAWGQGSKNLPLSSLCPPYAGPMTSGPKPLVSHEQARQVWDVLGQPAL